MKTVNYQDKTLTLTQNAYISDDGLHYRAHAVDEEGNDYRVIWQCKQFDEDSVPVEDESEMCNWDEYEVIEL